MHLLSPGEVNFTPKGLAGGKVNIRLLIATNHFFADTYRVFVATL